jgi:hypothetical protein
VTILRAAADVPRALAHSALLIAAVAAIVAIRLVTPTVVPGADRVDVASLSPVELSSHGSDALEAALGPGGSGVAFEVSQQSTLYAKPEGPRIELRSADDPTTVIGIVDEHVIGTVLSEGGVTADAFWMEVRVSIDPASADWSEAGFFARVLEQNGTLWRDDGAGWYLTDVSPGVGMDPGTARALVGALRSLEGVSALEPAAFDGQTLTGIRGTSTPEAYPGVIAADGASFTEQAFQVDCWFDDAGRLVWLEARARNLNQETYDLISHTVVTFTYEPPGDPPEPSPTMAPEPLPTSEPEAAEVAE